MSWGSAGANRSRPPPAGGRDHRSRSGPGRRRPFRPSRAFEHRPQGSAGPGERCRSQLRRLHCRRAVPAVSGGRFPRRRARFAQSEGSRDLGGRPDRRYAQFSDRNSGLVRLLGPGRRRRAGSRDHRHPIAGELYSARRAGGAFLNGQPIKVSGATDLTRARICVGFSYRRPVAEHVRAVGSLLSASCEYLRVGSGALGLAYTAAGRFDGY